MVDGIPVRVDLGIATLQVIPPGIRPPHPHPWRRRARDATRNARQQLTSLPTTAQELTHRAMARLAALDSSHCTSDLSHTSLPPPCRTRCRGPHRLPSS